jgi:hypothetical protein
VEIELTPITAADVPRVAAFLHEHLNSDVPAEDWARGMQIPWPVAEEHVGFMLLDESAVVGAQLTYYSVRSINGSRERFCNLAAWCVLPAYRAYSLRLLRTILRQEGYHFTTLTPIPDVATINLKFGFHFLDTATALVPGIPWPSWPGRYEITEDPALIERALSGPNLRIYRDHVGAPAAHHLLLRRGNDRCYVMFRWLPGRRLRFAAILHVSDARLFCAMTRPLARYMLFHHGAVGTLAEGRIAPGRLRASIPLRKRPRKMFRSKTLSSDQIDDLYSELVCLSW